MLGIFIKTTGDNISVPGNSLLNATVSSNDCPKNFLFHTFHHFFSNSANIFHLSELDHSHFQNYKPALFCIQFYRLRAHSQDFLLHPPDAHWVLQPRN